MIKNNLSDKKEVYIVFSKTNTLMGKVIRGVTRNVYNHVSLALEDDLEIMYSFGRYHINSPLVGGFILENPSRYLLGKKDVTTKICTLSLEEEEYANLKSELLSFIADKSTIIYNSFSAVFSVFHKKLHIDKAYTCIEFVTSILKIDDVINIKELEELLKDNVIYEGSFKEYVQAINLAQDEYFEKQPKLYIMGSTVAHFIRLFFRLWT